MTLEEYLAAESAQVSALETAVPGHRPSCNPEGRVIGRHGEAMFALRYGLRLPATATVPGVGDGGTDFVVPWRMRLDVKTARIPKYLIAEEGKINADVYVLIDYTDLQPIGWEYAGKLRLAPVKVFPSGLRNHAIPREALRPMAEFDHRLLSLR